MGGNVNESLQGIWLLPHFLTFGWSSGSRRRHFRKTFRRLEASQIQDQDSDQEQNGQLTRTQQKTPAKLYKASYDYGKVDDVIKKVRGDLTEKIKDSITRAGESTKLRSTEHITASVKTAIHSSNTDNNETRMSAIIEAKLKDSLSDEEVSIHPHDIIDINNTVTEMAIRNNQSGDSYVKCGLKVHFTVKELVKELGYRAKEGALEELLEKTGRLGHERYQLAEHLPQEDYDENERRLWDEWKSQVDMWHASNEGRKGGWDKDVMYWSDVLARFDKGDNLDSLARKEMVQWEVCTDQLRRVADATAAAAQAGLETVVANATGAESELEVAARAMTRVAEVADLEGTGEDDALKKIWSILSDIKGAFGRVPVEVLTGTLTKVVAGVAQTLIREGEEDKTSQTGAEKRPADSDKDVQTAIRSATGQLAGIAGALAQTLYPPLLPSPGGIGPMNEAKGKANENNDCDLRDKISQTREAVDRMLQSAKVLETGSAPDTDAWEEMKSYAVRAKEAAERAAKAIGNAMIQWKLTDEQRSEALCCRIRYPSSNSTGHGGVRYL